MNRQQDSDESGGTDKSHEVDENIDAADELDEDVGELRRRYLLRRFWKQGGAGFWGKHGDRLSWVLSGTLLLIILLNLATSYGMNVWNRLIFDALEQRDSHTVFVLA